MRKTVIVILMVAGSVGLSTRFHSHYIRSYSRAELFWTPSEAYLFVSTIQMGWAPTYTQLAASFIRSYFGGNVPPERTRHSFTVVWFNSDEMERQTIDDMEAQPASLEGGAIFNGPGWKWSHTRLEPTSTDEQRRYSSSLPWKKPLSLNPNGWAYNCCVLPALVGETKHAIELNGLRLQFVARLDKNDQVSFVLQKPNADEMILLALDERPHLVTQNRYEALIQK